MTSIDPAAEYRMMQIKFFYLKMALMFYFIYQIIYHSIFLF